MSRVILVSFLILLVAGGCVKNELKENTITDYKHVYLYTVCKIYRDVWPPINDTIRQLPDGVELSLIWDDKGWSCYKNDNLIFQCSNAQFIEPDACMYVGNYIGYLVCDDTLVFEYQSNPFGNILYANHFDSPVSVLENCGECSYSVWRVLPN